VDPAAVTVVEAHFVLEPEDVAAVDTELRDATYVVGRRLDNTAWHRLDGGPGNVTFAQIRKDLARLGAHVDGRVPAVAEGTPAPDPPSAELNAITKGWSDSIEISGEYATNLGPWLKKVLPLVDEKNRLLVELSAADRTAAACCAYGTR
jgi:hypothetical protein